MDVNELSDLILRKCKAKGLCQDGQRQWDGSSKSSLLKNVFERTRIFCPEQTFIIVFH